MKTITIRRTSSKCVITGKGIKIEAMQVSYAFRNHKYVVTGLAVGNKPFSIEAENVFER